MQATCVSFAVVASLVEQSPLHSVASQEHVCGNTHISRRGVNEVRYVHLFQDVSGCRSGESGHLHCNLSKLNLILRRSGSLF